MAKSQKAESQAAPVKVDKTTGEIYRELLEVDPKTALELAIQECDRAKQRVAEANEVRVTREGILVARNLKGLMEIGRMCASSGIVPTKYQGEKKIYDCAIAAQLAMRLRVDVVTLLQHLYIVYGIPSLPGKFMVGLLNASGHIQGRVRYEFAGTKWEPDWACTAFVKDKEGNDHCATIDWDMVLGEGWDQPKKLTDGSGMVPSKWRTMPEQMFKYRSGAFLCRGDFPEVILGLQTTEEMEDRYRAMFIDDQNAVYASDALDGLPAISDKPQPPATPIKTITVPSGNGGEKKAEEPPEPEDKKPEEKTVAPDQKPTEPEQKRLALSEYTNAIIEKIGRCNTVELCQRYGTNARTPSSLPHPLEAYEIAAIDDAVAKQTEKIMKNSATKKN